MQAADLLRSDAVNAVDIVDGQDCRHALATFSGARALAEAAAQPEQANDEGDDRNNGNDDDRGSGFRLLVGHGAVSGLDADSAGARAASIDCTIQTLTVNPSTPRH